MKTNGPKELDPAAGRILDGSIFTLCLLGLVLGIGLMLPGPIAPWVGWVLLTYFLVFPGGFLSFARKPNEEDSKWRKALRLSFLITHWFVFASLVFKLVTASG